jgi:hypothetical protein
MHLGLHESITDDKFDQIKCLANKFNDYKHEIHQNTLFKTELVHVVRETKGHRHVEAFVQCHKMHPK